MALLPEAKSPDSRFIVDGLGPPLNKFTMSTPSFTGASLRTRTSDLSTGYAHKLVRVSPTP